MNSLPGSERSAGSHGLSVLYLPKANRSDYFRRFLMHGKREFGWRIVVPCQAAHRAGFVDIAADGGRCIDLPDFSLRQAWEQDAEAVAALDAMMAECERFNRVPANRLLLSGSRNVGRGYSIDRHVMPNSRLARYALSDNMAGANVIRRMFRFAFDMLEETKPDLIIAGEWTTPFYCATVMIARTRGIKCLANRNSKIISGNFFWTSDLMMFNERSRHTARNLAQSGAALSAQAQEAIASFRNKPETLGFVGQKWVRREGRGIKGFNLPYLRTFASQLRAQLRGVPHTQPDPALGMLFNQYRAAIMKRLHQRYFRSYGEDELKAKRFVYFPLHKEGEVALTFQAPPWYDQANTIRQLSISLPLGYKLLVREHRANHGSRSSRWYRYVSRLPNVVLVSSFDSQFMFLRHAALVVTENGTSGWEALLLGKPVITLAESHYDGTALSRYVGDPADLPAAMLELLSQPTTRDKAMHDRRICWQIDAEREHSFSGEVADIPQAFTFLARY